MYIELAKSYIDFLIVIFYWHDILATNPCLSRMTCRVIFASMINLNPEVYFYVL